MTIFTRYMAVFTILLAGVAGITQNAAADGYSKQKVVYHINYDGKTGTSYKSALGNIQNHINAVGAENLDIKVVLHGDGLGLLKSAKTEDALKTRVGGLKSQNVKFNVCNNTLVGRKISWENDLYDTWQEDIVPSGVAELAKLQQEGYVYIKP